MHVVVIGAGAVGGYFGARLAQSGTKVTFLVRERRYQQLQETGLEVRSTYGDFSVTNLQLALSAQEIEDPDVVLLAVKNYHLTDVLPQLELLVNKGAMVLPLLNGVEHMDVLSNKFGRDVVAGGSCYIESTLDNSGRVVHTSPMHDIVFGSLDSPAPQWVEDLAQAFAASDVNVKVSDKILQDMWKKFIFLVSFSGITTATRSPIGVALGDPETTTFLHQLVREILSVAQARQIGLQPDEAFQQLLYRLEKTSPSMTSSLHRDLEKGLPLEIDSLQGSVLRMGKESNLEVPAMRAIYALLHPFANGSPR